MSGGLTLRHPELALGQTGCQAPHEIQQWRIDLFGMRQIGRVGSSINQHQRQTVTQARTQRFCSRQRYRTVRRAMHDQRWRIDLMQPLGEVLTL